MESTPDNGGPSSRSWPARTAAPDLLAHGIHVWRVDLAIPAAAEDRLAALLDDDERDRAGRFRFDVDRRRFIASHGALRLLLGQFLNVPPGSVELAYGRYGKPRLGPEEQDRHIQFNMAHSHELALIAVGREQALGVDVERVRPIPEIAGIAERFYSREEQLHLAAALETEREQATFFTCWTRKEAIIKGLGEGFHYPSATFTVSLGPDEPPAVLADESPGAPLLGWFLHDLQPGEGYAGALAATRAAAVHAWTWAW